MYRRRYLYPGEGIHDIIKVRQFSSGDIKDALQNLPDKEDQIGVIEKELLTIKSVLEKNLPKFGPDECRWKTYVYTAGSLECLMRDPRDPRDPNPEEHSASRTEDVWNNVKDKLLRIAAMNIGEDDIIEDGFGARVGILVWDIQDIYSLVANQRASQVGSEVCEQLKQACETEHAAEIDLAKR